MLPLVCWTLIAPGVAVALYQVPVDIKTLFGACGQAVVARVDPLADADHGDHGGGVSAPMPGKVIALLVAAGDTVHAGQPLAVMEAMKMEHTLAAPADGTVGALHYAVGDQVAEGAALMAFEAHADVAAAA